MILAVAIYALVNLATVRFVVDGPSMEPNFQDDQYLMVSRIHYLFNEPERGDIIVFHYPEQVTDDYIKRIIGIPGDTIELRDARLYINGEIIDEPYINEPCAPRNCAEETWQLDPDEYFVMGDNRNHSRDSRIFDAIRRDHIVGEVIARYWPPGAWGLVNHINYPEG